MSLSRSLFGVSRTKSTISASNAAGFFDSISFLSIVLSMLIIRLFAA